MAEEEQVSKANGLALSSRIPPIYLIPTEVIDVLADRFQTGIDRKGDKSWNAISSNQAVLDDIDFAIDRCGHAVRHAMQLRDKLHSRDIEGLKVDNDAAAILWAGAFLACVVNRLMGERDNGNSVQE